MGDGKPENGTINSAAKDLKDHDDNKIEAWCVTCELLKDARWHAYVNTPHDQSAIDGMLDHLSIDGIQPPFYLDYKCMATQPGSLNGDWNADGMV